MNRAIWLAADEAGFPRIAHRRYVNFIALRREPSFKQKKNKGKEQLLRLKNFLNTFLLAKVKLQGKFYNVYNY
jgi:hypothetical protein